MEGHIIFMLFFVMVLGEKKVSLEDIELDNLRQEMESPENSSDVKHYVKFGINQIYVPKKIQGSRNSKRVQNHQRNTHADINSSVTDSKYDVKEYNLSDIYAESDNSHREATVVKDYTRVAQEFPQLTRPSTETVYQPGIENNIGTLRQEPDALKYFGNGDRDLFYFTIPTYKLSAHQLSSPDLKVNSKTQPQSLFHQSANNLPSSYSASSIQDQFDAPGQFIHQSISKYTNYVPKKNSHAQFVTTSKESRSKLSSVTHEAKAPSNSQLPSPTYAQAEPIQSQKQDILYLTKQTPEFTPEFIYIDPKANYDPASSIYTDHYRQTPAYLQDNTLNSYTDEYDTTQQYYTPTNLDNQLLKLLKMINYFDTPRNLEQNSREPTKYLTPPQYSPPEFKSGVTQLHPVSADKGPAIVSQPRSLLESYVPSYIIAAQDSARYEEKPLRLEGGFVPSRMSSIYLNNRKRKSEEYSRSH